MVRLLMFAALGFAAAALSQVTVVQAWVWLVGHFGYTQTPAWNMQPMPGWNIPTLAYFAIRSGIWGCLFGMVYPWVPGRFSWLKGIVFSLTLLIV